MKILKSRKTASPAYEDVSKIPIFSTEFSTYRLAMRDIVYALRSRTSLIFRKTSLGMYGF
jgi:hypothetical protein